MHKRMLTPLTLAMLLAGGAAYAQQQPAPPPTAAAPGQQNVMTADRLMDMEVTGAQNEKIGEVEELVINSQSGKVDGIVVSVGGFLGIGDKDVMLPWDQVKFTQDGLQTQATKQQLEQAQAWKDPNQQTARGMGGGSERTTTPGAGSPPPATGTTR